MLGEGERLNEVSLSEKVTGKKHLYRGVTSRSTRKRMRKKSMHREAGVEVSVPCVSEKNWIDNTSHTLYTISSFFTISASFLYYLLQSKHN